MKVAIFFFPSGRPVYIHRRNVESFTPIDIGDEGYATGQRTRIRLVSGHEYGVTSKPPEVLAKFGANLR